MYGIKERGLNGDSFSFVSYFREKSKCYYENNIIGGIYMITLSVLTIILLTIAIIAAVTVLTCGAGFIVAFGDIIIAALIIGLIIKLFKRKK